MTNSKSVKMELFKAGKQTDSAGNSRTWTKSDLDKIATQFAESGEKIPATIGHQVKNKPAFAWFNKIWRDGDSLFGEMSDVVDEFGAMLKKKMFKNRSIALRPNFSLRHVAFLGAEPPAVKGLEDFAFSDDDEFITIEFSAGAKKKEPAPEFNEPKPETKPEDPKMDELETAKAKISELEGQIAEFTESAKEKDSQIETLTGERDAARAEFSEYKENETKNKFNERLDGLVKAGKITPANKAAHLEIALSLDGNNELEYSEDGDNKKKSPVDIYFETLEGAGNAVEFGEFANDGAQGADKAEAELSKLTRERAAEKGISFSEASREIQAENPKLVQSLNIQTQA